MTTTRHSYRTEFGVEMRRISWEQFWSLRPDLRPASGDQEGLSTNKLRTYPSAPMPISAGAATGMASMATRRAAQTFAAPETCSSLGTAVRSVQPASETNLSRCQELTDFSFAKSALAVGLATNRSTQIDATSCSRESRAALMAISRAVPAVTQPPHVKPSIAAAIAPPATP